MRLIGGTVGWRSTIATAILHSVFQTVAFGVAAILRRPTEGWFGYFAVLVFVCPVAERWLAKALLHIPGPLQAWRAWAVSVFTLMVLLFGEGFAEAGLHPAIVFAIMAGVTFIGGLASSWSPYVRELGARES